MSIADTNNIARLLRETEIQRRILQVLIDIHPRAQSVLSHEDMIYLEDPEERKRYRDFPKF